MQNSNFQIPTTFLQNSIARQERLRKQQLERKESPQPAKTPSKDSTLDQIKQLEEKRNQRRQRDLIIKQNQQGINQSQRDSISFSKLLLKVKEKYLQIPSKSLLQPSSKGITVCIRKRPLPNPSDSNFDIVSCSNSNVFIHEPKVKLNGDLNIDTHKFLFDCVFDESSSNSDVYTCIVKDLVDKMFKGGKVLLFAYGLFN